MLVLSRNVGEDIIIPLDGGREIEIKLCDITPAKGGGYKAKLGFTAPRDVVIHRREVWERVLAEGGGGAEKGEKAG